MKTSIVRSATFSALLLACAAYADAAMPDTGSSQSSYSVFDLGTPLGGTFANAVSINDLGWAVGQATLPGDTTMHAELWLYGAAIDLKTLGGPNSAVAWPNRNDLGQIAGISETAAMDPNGEDWSCGLAVFFTITHHVCVGVVWKDGKMAPLPTLGGTNGFATGINNLGQVVGWAENATHDPTCDTADVGQVLQFEAVMWAPKHDGGYEAHALPPYPGDLDGAATAINQQGQVVGISGICDQAAGRFSAVHAVLWDHGHVTDLGNFGGVAWNTPMDINNRGDVAGFSDFPGDGDGAPNFHAFFWTKGHPMQDIGTLVPGRRSLALGINDRDQVVGESAGRAFIWEHNKLTDLNQLVSNPNPSLILVFAQEINDSGVIVGNASDAANGTSPAFIAIPHMEADGTMRYKVELSTGNAGSKGALPKYLRQLLQEDSAVEGSRLR